MSNTTTREAVTQMNIQEWRESFKNTDRAEWAETHGKALIDDYADSVKTRAELASYQAATASIVRHANTLALGIREGITKLDHCTRSKMDGSRGQKRASQKIQLARAMEFAASMGQLYKTYLTSIEAFSDAFKTPRKAEIKESGQADMAKTQVQKPSE